MKLPIFIFLEKSDDLAEDYTVVKNVWDIFKNRIFITWDFSYTLNYKEIATPRYVTW